MPANPVQATANTLDAIKNAISNPYKLEIAAPLDASLSAGSYNPGTVVHLSSSLTFLLGVGNTNRMPLFLFQGSNDADVQNFGGNPATQIGPWIPIIPTGAMNALVATGAYELVTTNYDTTQTYTPNTLLTASDTGSIPGILTVGVVHTNVICGIVSRGVTDNGYGYPALAFWPIVFLV